MELLDVSNVNGSVDWNAVHRAGIKGAWLKATEGVTFDDSFFSTHRRRANAAGLRVGGYHFARPDLNKPEAEADHFCRVIGKLGRRELRPVLDMEHAASGDLVAWSRAFNKRVRARLGCDPVFYSYPDFISHLGASRPIGNGLWLASYGPNDGKRHGVLVPKPWKRSVAHQYTSRGSVPGVSGNVDRSYAPRLRGVLAHPVIGLL